MRLAWLMRIQRWDPADETTAAACYEVHRAAHLADEADDRPYSAGTFDLYLREGFDKTPGEVWYAADDDAGVVGYYRMQLWDLENLDCAFSGPVVHPAARRRGHGRALLRHEAARAAASRRSVLTGKVATGSAGEAFAVAVGATPGLVEVRRVQYLAKIEPGKVAELRRSAARAAAGYSLVSWTGDVPKEYLGPVAQVINAFEDAPRGENVQPESWDADRVRERTGAHVRAGLLRAHAVAALHDATGEMAAYTGVIVDPTTPSWGLQELTAVTRAHRGHRLGLLVKTGMLELLAEVEPQVELIMTSNAAANDHMIAVNEQLGYEVSGPGWRFYAAPVAELLGQS
jgi:GNAT superfamily N-acetyltransferase